ncbi:DNA-directed RNA polymerases I, II, and III subunit RPABC1 [Gonapodya sp. JEL0774]|nr:DNA-directed RNA polymerases I, II, and III subunit RPABC1 [Gonapodya sp. JEL0774]
MPAPDSAPLLIQSPMPDSVPKLSYDDVFAELEKVQKIPVRIKNPLSFFHAKLPQLQDVHPGVQTPAHVVEILAVQKERSERLGKLWVEQETKNSVYGSIISESVFEPTAEEMASAERALEEARLERQEIEKEYQDLSNQVLEVAQAAYEGVTELEKDAATLYGLAMQSKQIEEGTAELQRALAQEEARHVSVALSRTFQFRPPFAPPGAFLSALCAYLNSPAPPLYPPLALPISTPQTALTSELRSRIAANENSAAALDRECEDLEAALAAQIEANRAVQAQVVARRAERDAAVAEARKVEEAADGVDVRVDELGAWYKEMHIILSRLVGIKAVNVHGENTVEVVFPSYVTDKDWKLNMRVAAGPNAGLGVDRFVEATVRDFPAPLDDILDDVNHTSTEGSGSRNPRGARLDHVMPRVVNEVVRRVRRWEARQAELRRIEREGRWVVKVEDAGSGCKVVLTATGVGQQVLTFWLDWDYPNAAACTVLNDVKVKNVADFAMKQRYKKREKLSGFTGFTEVRLTQANTVSTRHSVLIRTLLHFSFVFAPAVWEMLRDRGYVAQEHDINKSLEEFRVLMNAVNGNRVDRSLLHIVARHDVDNSDLMVFFPSEEKVGIKEVKRYLEVMASQNVGRAIIVYQSSITPSAQKALANLIGKYEIESFAESELIVNITQHTLVPQHTVLSKEEKQTLLQR